MHAPSVMHLVHLKNNVTPFMKIMDRSTHDDGTYTCMHECIILVLVDCNEWLSGVHVVPRINGS
jgi:hypothetical protein